ncbi:unnamed protein product [Bursaphelenchus xylophilus]|uniref:(pine wood nematode) hypothetical protein n=1 Tax=Bursaphelenchus xylophilus TaxID=6326 RepID=A0A1I7SHI8_BURXY|nr:unnamed protein product [Bursaphelenchus xylophilus]CAG9121313.1 unnamed protein product [Bursaphelenchus xylophilus]
MFGLNRFFISFAFILLFSLNISAQPTVVEGYRRFKESIASSSPSYRPVYVGGGLLDVYEKPVSSFDELTTIEVALD